MVFDTKNKRKTLDEFPSDALAHQEDIPARDLLADLEDDAAENETAIMPQDIIAGGDAGSGDAAVMPALAGMSRDIPRVKIKPSPYNPRKTFDEDAINALAESIRTVGLLQAIIVRKIDVPVPGEHGTTYSHYYEIVGGERRFRACTRAGLSPIPCRVIPMTDGQAREIAIIENLQREDLSPLEEAAALSAMVESGMTQTQLAARIGKSQDRISRRIGLLRLPPAVQALIEEKKLSASHGERLQSWAGQPAVCEAIALRCASEGWSVSRLDGSGGSEVAAIVAEVTGVQSLDFNKEASEAEEAEDTSLQTNIYDIPQVTDPLPPPEPSVPAVPVVDDATPVREELAADLVSTIIDHAQALSRDEEKDTGTDADADAEVETVPAPKASPVVDVTPMREGTTPFQPLPEPPAQTPEIVTTPAPVANGEPTLEGGPSAPAPAKRDPAPPVPSPTGSGITVLFTQADDDWIFDNGYDTFAQAFADLRRRVGLGVDFTPGSLNALRAITDSYNNEHPDAPASLTTTLETCLLMQAETLGFDRKILQENPHE